ncbi:hypothetical protein DFJ74DRAFT_771207 [Hyaloraphidium curvatum]|nr:hypothetical protein DFJ74DRAFT_771207 [Hyaloraphidium curvatum]
MEADAAKISSDGDQEKTQHEPCDGANDSNSSETGDEAPAARRKRRREPDAPEEKVEKKQKDDEFDDPFADDTAAELELESILAEAEAKFSSPATSPAKPVSVPRSADRDSVFVGHAIGVPGGDENAVADAMKALRAIPEYRDSQHYMFAVRLRGPPPRELKDDDEEAYGAKRIADVLEAAGIEDLLVAVSRVFGGTLLGAARFTHIAACARNALAKLGLGAGSGPQEQHPRAAPPADGPKCSCGTPANLNTVSKENKNKGREFFGCPKYPAADQCGFFKWREDWEKEKAGAGSSRARPGGSSSRGGSSPYRSPGRRGGPSSSPGKILSHEHLCEHGEPTVQLVAKSGANAGRKFYKCNRQEQCRFFAWGK